MFSKKTNFKFKAKFPDPRGHAEKRPAHCSLEFGPNSAVQAKEGAEGSVTNDSQMISKKSQNLSSVCLTEGAASD